MKRLSGLLLLLLTLAFGFTLAAGGEGEASTESDRKLDSQPAAENGAEVDPEPEQESSFGAEGATDIDASTIRTEAEADAAFEALATQGEEQAGWPNTATQFLATQEDLSIFLMLLEQAGLTETVAEADQPITIFAPNDRAFAEMDPLHFSTLVDDPVALRAFLERHIATDRYSTAELSAGLASTGPSGGPSEKAVTAGVNMDAAGGGEGVLGLDPDNAAAAEVDAVAGGGAGGDVPDGDVPSATVTTPDPHSFVRVDTRSGAALEIGPRPATVRSELLRQSDPDFDSAVAGGGAAAETSAPTASSPGSYYVGDSQIIAADLGVDEVTVHIIDAVLLPPEDGATEDAAPQ